jgi:hypothetical protein
MYIYIYDLCSMPMLPIFMNVAPFYSLPKNLERHPVDDVRRAYVANYSTFSISPFGLLGLSPRYKQSPEYIG